MLPCLARPLSLSCHATTIAQLDVSVCLMFKRVVLCTCAPCCLALACLVPLLPRLPCVPCVPCGSVCCAWRVCLACCVSLLPSCPCALPLACPALPHCACAVCPCPGCCVAWPVLTGLVPCCLAPAVFSLCPGCSYPSEGKPCIFLGGYLAPSTGVSSFVRLALTHGLLCSLHGVLLVLCCSYGLELLPCHCLLPCLLHSGIKARMHRAFIFLKKIPENIFRVIPPGVTFSRIFSWPFSEPDVSGKLPCSHLRYPGLHPAAGDS